VVHNGSEPHGRARYGLLYGKDESLCGRRGTFRKATIQTLGGGWEDETNSTCAAGFSFKAMLVKDLSKLPGEIRP
jgi:hypothetical protein